MGFPKMFNLPSNNRFEYQPLYYDEKKEKMRERLGKYNKDNDNEKNYIPDIKGKFKTNRSHSSSYSSQKRISNIRLLVIIGFIGFIAFYILENQGIISYMFNILFEK